MPHIETARPQCPVTETAQTEKSRTRWKYLKAVRQKVLVGAIDQMYWLTKIGLVCEITFVLLPVVFNFKHTQI